MTLRREPAPRGGSRSDPPTAGPLVRRCRPGRERRYQRERPATRVALAKQPEVIVDGRWYGDGYPGPAPLDPRREQVRGPVRRRPDLNSHGWIGGSDEMPAERRVLSSGRSRPRRRGWSAEDATGLLLGTSGRLHDYVAAVRRSPSTPFAEGALVMHGIRRVGGDRGPAGDPTVQSGRGLERRGSRPTRSGRRRLPDPGPTLRRRRCPTRTVRQLLLRAGLAPHVRGVLTPDGPTYHGEYEAASLTVRDKALPATRVWGALPRSRYGSGERRGLGTPRPRAPRLARRRVGSMRTAP